MWQFHGVTVAVQEASHGERRVVFTGSLGSTLESAKKVQDFIPEGDLDNIARFVIAYLRGPGRCHVSYYSAAEYFEAVVVELYGRNNTFRAGNGLRATTARTCTRDHILEALTDRVHLTQHADEDPNATLSTVPDYALAMAQEWVIEQVADRARSSPEIYGVTVEVNMDPIWKEAGKRIEAAVPDSGTPFTRVDFPPDDREDFSEKVENSA